MHLPPPRRSKPTRAQGQGSDTALSAVSPLPYTARELLSRNWDDVAESFFAIPYRALYTMVITGSRAGAFSNSMLDRDWAGFFLVRERGAVSLVEKRDGLVWIFLLPEKYVLVGNFLASHLDGERIFYFVY